MKLRKITAAAASAIAAAALAVSANAALVVPDGAANGCDFGTGNWMVRVYCPDMNVDYGVDWSQLGSYSVTITPIDHDWWEGATGGAMYVSCGPTSVCPSDHNWVSSAYWGVVDEDLELDTQDPSNPILLEKVGDYLYKGTLQVTDDNCVYEEVYGDPGAYIQIGFQEWGQDMSEIEVVSMECYDKSGNLMATFDGKGNITVAATAPMRAGAAAAAEPAAAETTTASDVAAAGDTTAAAVSSKGSPDTGVADVAAVAGIAVVAAGAFIVAKKRK
ncbi:MAG: hypothetical protein K5876_05670 [Ruminiclostridium sp.]|nr:hypothetical protein [Ruminiclostridium sp.]